MKNFPPFESISRRAGGLIPILLCIGLGCLEGLIGAGSGPYRVRYPYGVPVSYGEGRHPGIDFDLEPGSPIVAASDGEVVYVGEPCPGEPHCGGSFVLVRHGSHFDTLYGHLRQAAVVEGQAVKRGDLIGRSGASNSGYAHLHFGVCKQGGECINYSASFDPQEFWIGKSPTCFDPESDYSAHDQTGLTLPIACGAYAESLAPSGN